MWMLTVSVGRYSPKAFPSLLSLSLGSTKALWVLIRTQFCSFSGFWCLSEGVVLSPVAATAAQVLVAVTAGALSTCARNAFTSSWSFSFCSCRTC
ncbi:unnamed protein product [Penicillium salamii]|uniref:Uncharacterized protein n=1 Tax=Penicillium salamii TaxID=1612424 RepID=A0A9W4I752_9EURO|nr:unnamed protein product [Penicillium salamii]